MAVVDLLYKGNPRLGKMLTLPPMKLFVLFSLASIVWLFVPAYIFGVLLLKNDSQESVGILSLYAWNWCVMFPLLIPLIFTLADCLGRKASESLGRLAKFGVITREDGSPAEDLAEPISN